MNSKINISILNEYIYKSKNLYILVQKAYYEDMYNTIYNYYLKKLNNNDQLDKFLHYAFMIYKNHNKLKNNLFIPNNLNDLTIDIDLIEFVVEKIFITFTNAYELRLISKIDFSNKLKERIELNYSVINNLKNKSLELRK